MSSPDRARRESASAAPVDADDPSAAIPALAAELEKGESPRRFALACIADRLEHGRDPIVDASAAPPDWRAMRACFVTLRIRGELRGCVGTFDDTRPLIHNVARSACRAAFADPRFGPLGREELPGLEVEVSILSKPAPLPVASRADLLGQLLPDVDGLIVSEGACRATFLPAVWASLPNPADFLDALLEKAGLPRDDWSPRLRFERYTTTRAN